MSVVPNDVEICLLTAFDTSNKLVHNPWRHRGFRRMVYAFIRDQAVLMGRHAWSFFPFKHCRNIDPWVVTHDVLFQQKTALEYSHVRFSESLTPLQEIPLKGIWWVLGGCTVFNRVLPYAHSVEAMVVNDAAATLNSVALDEFAIEHTCPNPFDRKMKCVRYARTNHPSISMHSMQAAGIR